MLKFSLAALVRRGVIPTLSGEGDNFFSRDTILEDHSKAANDKSSIQRVLYIGVTMCVRRHVESVK